MCIRDSSSNTSSSPARSSQVNHQSRWDPSLPGDLTYLGTDYTGVSTTNSLNFSEPNQRNPPNPQIPIGIVWKRVGCVLGIEPNEHRTPRFQGKHRSSYSSLRKPWETQFSQCSPYVSVMLRCRILRFNESQFSIMNWGELWGWGEDPLSFSESGCRCSILPS